MRQALDACSREGAERLAKMVAAFWAKRGLDVVTTVVDTGAKAEHGLSGANVWGVRSNMVNGMPQKVR